jgi:hypothetical protein
MLAQVIDGPCLFFTTPHSLSGSEQEIALFIRPESIAVSRHPLADDAYANQLTGQIISILFDGANSTALVRIAGYPATLQVALPHNGLIATLHAGDQVHLGIAPEHVQAFTH